MNKKQEFIFFLFSIFLLVTLLWHIGKDTKNLKELTGTIISTSSYVTILDDNQKMYQIMSFPNELASGDRVVLKYTGLLDELKEVQSVEVREYKKEQVQKDSNGIPNNLNDKGIFSDFYIMAYNKLKTLSLDEKIGQLLLVRYSEDIKDNVSGFVFYEKDFKDKTKEEVITMMDNLNKNAKIPLLLAVDEEGGNVTRISSNQNLVSEKFKSPSELYEEGGFEKIREDTKLKSKVLHELGLNLNLAPVVDVATPSDYIYPRTLKQDVDVTSKYAKTVIEASKGTNVSYTLKHFPGYAGNQNTHLASSLDDREYEEVLNDIKPFREGIESGAEAVLVSHNIVSKIDNMPSSLSIPIHNLLRNELGFSGVIITDDISMKALEDFDDKTLKAVISLNNLIITSDYETSFHEIKNAVKDKVIDEVVIDQLAFKVLAWKYYKGLLYTK